MKVQRALWASAFAVAGWCAAASAQPWVDADRADQLLRDEKFLDAASAYKALIDANPYDGRSWSQYGYVLHGAKQYDQALAAFAKDIELGVKPSGNLYNSACSHALLGTRTRR